ncbi:hypothetical protein BCR32DRAFT_230653, partial [Anaeromyces robustus]
MSSPPAAANLLGQPSQQISLSSDLLGGGDFQRPASEILVGSGMTSGQAVHNNLASQAGRPASEVINKNFKSPEADAIDRLFEDLSYYERTLEEMAKAKLDDNFREELKAIEQWFSVLSNCERTTALYSLLQQATPVQIRFFITVLQQMAQKETPGNVDKGSYLYPPKSPGMNSRKFYPRHSAPIDENDGIYHHPHHDDNRGYMSNRRGSTHSLKGKDEMMKQKMDLEMTGMNNVQGWAYGNNQNNLRERTSSLQQQQHHNNHKNSTHINTKRSFNKMNSPKSPAFQKSPAFPKPDPLSPLPLNNKNGNDKNMPPLSPGGSNKWGSSSNRGGYAHSEYSDVDDDANSRKGSQYRPGSTAGSTTAGSVSGKDNKGKIPDKIELELLEDIPTWLRSLRLHKYTNIFQSMSWKEMVILNDDELTQKGVAALGARRKLLKVFAMVQEEAKKQNIELPKPKSPEIPAETKEKPEEEKAAKKEETTATTEKPNDKTTE